MLSRSAAAPGVNAAASPAPAAPVRVNLPPVTFPTAAIAPPGLVLGSAVASVVAGPQAAPVLVRAANPHLVWDRSLTTEALLGLAVQPALTASAKHCTEGLVARAEELLRAYSSNTLVRAALGELTASFQSAECVACLESEPPPDALLLPCGHICMHWEEAARVETCPLCRKLISARICVSNGKYVAAPGRQVRSPASFYCPPFLTPVYSSRGKQFLGTRPISRVGCPPPPSPSSTCTRPSILWTWTSQLRWRPRRRASLLSSPGPHAAAWRRAPWSGACVPRQMARWLH